MNTVSSYGISLIITEIKVKKWLQLLPSVNKINGTQKIRGDATLLATPHFQHHLKIFLLIKY